METLGKPSASLSLLRKDWAARSSSGRLCTSALHSETAKGGQASIRLIQFKDGELEWIRAKSHQDCMSR